MAELILHPINQINTWTILGSTYLQSQSTRKTIMNNSLGDNSWLPDFIWGDCARKPVRIHRPLSHPVDRLPERSDIRRQRLETYIAGRLKTSIQWKSFYCCYFALLQKSTMKESMMDYLHVILRFFLLHHRLFLNE